jgi:hypothetical protein
MRSILIIAAATFAETSAAANTTPAEEWWLSVRLSRERQLLHPPPTPGRWQYRERCPVGWVGYGAYCSRPADRR